MMVEIKTWWQNLPKPIKAVLTLCGLLIFAGLEDVLGVGFVKWVWAYILSLKPTYDYSTYFGEHPVRAMMSGFLLSLLLAPHYFFIRTIKRQAHRIGELKFVRDGFGISHYWDSRKEEQMSAAWAACAKHIADHPTDLRIMGASGWNTFSSPSSPLHEVLRTYRGRVQVLLMDPESPCLAARAESLERMTAQKYKDEINYSINFLQDIKNKKNPHIELKLYKHPLIWKIIETPSFLWLQHYVHGEHVADTPVYGFKSASQDKNSLVENTSLYLPLVSVFKKRWELDGSLTSRQILN